MEQITIKNLTFAYNSHSDFSLNDISLEIVQGEIFLITGVSGCGKTTLLRHLKKDYMPQGIRSAESSIWIAGRVGFVGQNVEEMQVTDKVWHELAFGLENLGYPQNVMQRKVAEMVAFFGLEEIYHEKLCNLSGGQKQLVNLAAVMVMEPEVLVLDEPTSQLDPIAATEFFRMIERINRELGTTIVMTEHRLEEVFAMSHRVCVMDKGRIVMVDTPQQIACSLWKNDHVLFEALPAATRLYLCLEQEGEQVPFTVNEGRRWLELYLEKNPCAMSEKTLPVVGLRREHGDVALHANEVWFRYESMGKDIVKACSLKLEKGKITALLGGNGTGKSTFLNVIAGHYTPFLGKVKNVSGTIGMLPQNPQAMFGKETVEEELVSSLLQGIKSRKMQQIQRDKLQEMIAFCDLQTVLQQHPFDLSGGQMQKLALAKLLLEDKDILLLDEPGKGMDYDFKEKMGALLRDLVSQGKTILMVSHDVEFCAKNADVCGLFFDGNIVSLTDSRSFFLQNSFYTTEVSRICRGRLLEVLIVEDVLQLFGHAKKRDVSMCMEEKEDVVRVTCKEEQSKIQVVKKDGKKSWIIALLTVFLIMPVTIYIGHTVLLQRKYYFISLLLVIEAIICFFLRFENRKPRIREIMTIAVMSAIVVASRMALYMVPSVKPMAALVILTGIGLGAEAGFLVGATSMLVSDIFFGQGPWTPWQMFAMGLLGFIAGMIFRQGEDCAVKKKLEISLFGLFSVVLIYGGIMNPASVLMYQENVNLEMILTACAMGLPFDIIHGVSTFVFLWVGCRPLLNKLKRVRDKFQFAL